MEDRIIAISATDAIYHGCPHCNAMTGTTDGHDATMSGMFRTCWKCKGRYVVVANEAIGLPVHITVDEKPVTLTVEAEHPRKDVHVLAEMPPFDEAGWATDRAYFDHMRAQGRIQ